MDCVGQTIPGYFVGNDNCHSEGIKLSQKKLRVHKEIRKTLEGEGFSACIKTCILWKRSNSGVQNVMGNF